MVNFDDVRKENIYKHNPNQPQSPDHPYRILIIIGSGSGKTSSLFNLINHQPDIDNIHLYAKDPYEAKYQLLINKRGNTGSKHLNDSKAFIEYSNDMDDIYNNIEEQNPNKKRKIIIVFDMITDILSNKKLNPILTELFNRGKFSCSYYVIFFTVPKYIRLNSMHYFIMKILQKLKPYLFQLLVLLLHQKQYFNNNIKTNHGS